jgi:hypothetical protein
MGLGLLPQPEAQRLADRLSPRQAPLAAESIEPIALAGSIRASRLSQ